ncbi:MAG: Transposase, Mutator family [Candidatus Parcubacteria bacterium]
MCSSSSTVRKGLRRGNIKLLCKSCGKWFQINRKRKLDKKFILIQHLDGASHRSIADQYSFSPMTSYRYCKQTLKALPLCADITRKYCSRFSGILLVDGKFVEVKGYQYKVPVIYGIDFLTHDIPTYVFATSENYHVLKKFFTSLRLLNYPLQSLVSDENMNFPHACFDIYPKASWQLCTNHLKENISRSLGVRTNPKYMSFMKGIETMFKNKISKDNFNKLARDLLTKYSTDELCVRILLDIASKQANLQAHLIVKKTPTTNNLIECMNSHLQGRLETIKGFESFQHANLWLNGYFIRRRTKRLTDCEGAFKKLNGMTPLQHSSKYDVDFSTFF